MSSAVKALAVMHRESWQLEATGIKRTAKDEQTWGVKNIMQR